MQAGYEQIGMAIVIVVTDRNSDVVSCASQTGGVGNVREDSIAIISKKPIAIFRRVFLQGGDVGAIGEKNIWAAIPVVIENCDSSRHRLGCVLRGRLIVLQTKWNSFEFEPD